MPNTIVLPRALPGDFPISLGRVIFAAPGTEPLLRVTPLESVGIVVGPVNKTRQRLPAIPLK